MSDDEIIDALGGTSAVSHLCDLTTGAVSQWRKKGIPPGWRKYFSAIRPDLFDTNRREQEPNT